MTENNSFWTADKIRQLAIYGTNHVYHDEHGTDLTSWDDMANELGLSPEECSKKFKSIKNVYARLLQKKTLGKPVKWEFFDVCYEVFKNDKAFYTDVKWDNGQIKQLLKYYIDNISKFRGPVRKHITLWKDIAEQFDISEYACQQKFRALKRTYFKCVEKNRDGGKYIKWPYYSYFQKMYENYNPDETKWSHEKIMHLLHLYAENAEKFANPQYQKKELWRQIAGILNDNPDSVDKKFRNLKQTYMKLKRLYNSGRRLTTKWIYYKDFEELYGKDTVFKFDEHITLSPQRKHDEQNYVKQILLFYIKNKDKFASRSVRNIKLWKIIGHRLGLSAAICDRKFRNLKQTYLRIAEEKRRTGKEPRWPYFYYFQRIYDTNISEENDLQCLLDTTSNLGVLIESEAINGRDERTNKMLTFFLQNKNKFDNPHIKKLDIWKSFASENDISEEECDRKFRSLKHTYFRLVEQKRQFGKVRNNWPYFLYFQKVFGDERMPEIHYDHNENSDLLTSEVRKVVNDIQQRKENNEKFDKLIQCVEESNNIQRERNRILLALLKSRK